MRPVPRFRIPWLPIALTLLVLFGGAAAVQPVRDAATLGDVAEAHLERPLAYIALAPLSSSLDTLTLLATQQHIAMVAGALALWLLYRLFRASRGDLAVKGHAISAAALLGSIVILYAAAAALPRPMAYLVADNANVVRVDFHSHTSASHDGRSGWGVEDNRAWHRAGGYDVAFITDHGTVAAAERGIVANPTPAALGVTVLQSIEVTWTGEHVGIIGAERFYKGILTENGRDVDESGLRLASLVPGREPVVIWNHPRNLDRLPIATERGAMGIRAIELSSGSPGGAQQVRPKRAALVALAQQNGIALVSGSDNHGWGRVAPNWTLLRISGWRGASSDSLAFEIEQAIRIGGSRATRVVERRVADPGTGGAQLVMSVFTVPWRMFTTLSTDERVMWIAWTWVVYGLYRWISLRRASRANAPA